MIVAAGFDAAAGDELGGCFVSPACYAHMTSMLMHLAHGKIAVCLEVCFGQYNAFSKLKKFYRVATIFAPSPSQLWPLLVPSWANPQIDYLLLQRPIRL